MTTTEPKHLTPIKAIRKHCLECSATSIREVRECHLKHCPLWPYRMGKRPLTLMPREAKKS